MLKDKLIKEIAKLTDTPEDQINLEIPEREEFGDYSTNIAMVNAKSSKTSPQKLAQEYIEKFIDSSTLMAFVSSVKMAGPGFINFVIKNEQFLSELESIKKAGNEYGKSKLNEGKSVVIEYSSPNIAKPFTVGHLRSTIIGDAIANLLETTSYKVYRDNHLGDWGTQFGKQIYALMNLGEGTLEKNIEKIEKAENPVKELVSLYVDFHSKAQEDPSLEDMARGWFKKLEDGDAEARDLWQKCIDWSWQEFNKIYKQLDINFTENDAKGYGESYFEDKMPEVLYELTEKNLLKEGEEGAKLVFFPDEKYPPLMILKKDGSTLYATRDLATDKFRLEKYGKDVLIINEVGAEQSLYFRQLFELEKNLGWVSDGQRVHIRHGLFRFKDKKMSTRKGNTIWLEDVINEAISRARKLGNENNQLAQDVAIGALKWNELKRDPVADIVFDWDEILNMQGNSGPYVQYTYARIQSVIEKASTDKQESVSSEDTIYPEERSVMRALSQYQGILATAAKNYSPNLLAQYLFDLAQKYNTFYNKHKIIGSDKEEFRLLLTQATGQVLKNGLEVLGIKAPEKM